MAFTDLLKKLFNSDSSKDLKELSEMTAHEIETLGNKIIDTTDEYSDKAKEWIDKEGSDLFAKAKKKFNEIHEKSEEEIKEFMDDMESEPQESSEDIFQDETVEESEENPEEKQNFSSTGVVDVESEDENEIQAVLDKADQELATADDLMNRGSNLEALAETELIPDDFIEEARRYAASSLSLKQDSDTDKSTDNKEIIGFTDKDGDGDYLIDEAFIEEE